MENAFETLFVGQSPELRAALRTAQVTAAVDVTVLVRGESGTGKELLAQAIHRHSRRADRPFVSINCAALPEHLVEAELFGHRKGAFTGADADRSGRVAAADRGTLFLDEIGDLPLNAQAKLLRVLETGECQRVGAHDHVRVDIRVIAATNRDLAQDVAEGNFREDLYYRLNVVPVELPPLRERTGDLPILLGTMTRTFAATHGIPAPAFSQGAMALLSAHPWPGNVRELRNLCERLVILMGGHEVQPDHLPLEFHAAPAGGSLARLGIKLPESGIDLAELEQSLISAALEKTRGNRSRAARLLGLTRDTLLYRMKKYTIA